MRMTVQSRVFVTLRLAVGVTTLATASAARAQSTTSLGATDFTLAVDRVDTSGNLIPLSSTGLASFFSAARCACPTNFGVALAMTSDGAAKLASTDSLSVAMMVGSNCDNVSASTPCTQIGANLTLSSGATSTSETLATSGVFDALAHGIACTALPSTGSTLWAIVRLDGALIGTQPSVAINLGGAASSPPTSVAAKSADSGLLVTWTLPSTLDTIAGYQVLCSPSPAAPSDAAFDSSCAASTPTGGTGPFATFDASVICSDLVASGTTSVRVKGLQNGTEYQVAVISIGNDGTGSTPSTLATGTPGPTLGFDDLYKQAGGTGLDGGGCSIAGAAGQPGRARPTLPAALALAAPLAWLASRRRRPRRRARRRPTAGARTRARTLGRVAPPLAAAALLLLLLLLRAGAAHAHVDPDPSPSPSMSLAINDDSSSSSESPRNWNLEFRFGPYYPNVDSELADRGSAARPFEQVFSSKQRLMIGLELDRQVLHRGGTWAIGFLISHYKASAAALAADQVTRSGDDTTLSFIPLSIQAIYRADILRERYHSPIIPYAKLGLDMAFWTISDSAKTGTTSGRTLGWNAAAGVALDLTFLDPEGVRTMDMETGVNRIALFFELTHLALDGFGSSSVLRLGDNTWLAGLMFEM